MRRDRSAAGPGQLPAYGRAGFLGGTGARKAHVLRTVITALHPAGAVPLARGVPAERIHRGRSAGPGTAVVAVGLPAPT
ncbi:hypothetical protein SUDANB176_04998 [Streptomyces sp. enrichment culture]|uniref:hypothetical protein n=1 Tax=Streptomyces sp. enrichment culture TaxID=1795815 RepID=UPI003F56C0BB